MDSKKQKLLIEYLISSPDTFALCSSIVKSNYFDPEYRNAVHFIQQYYEQHNTTPGCDILEAETDIQFKYKDVAKDEIEYCSIEIEKFCKRKAIQQASIKIPELVKTGDYGAIEELIKDAIMVSLNKNLGLRYFEDPEERLRRMMINNPVISTGWSDIDEALFGGISRQELLLVSANSGGGKSITLANLAYNFIEQGKNVLYISLELSEDVVAQRFDTLFTGITRNEWKDHVDDIVIRLKGVEKDSGILDIVQFPADTNANSIRAYLKEYYLHYDMMPDLLVVDYLDEMSPNQFVSADNVFEKDKRCASQLRQIGVDHNIAVATASQLNRTAIGASSHDHSQIAGGISKINICDTYFSIIMNDAMRAAGEIAFHLQKTRNSNGVGKTFYLKWDAKRLRITDDKNGNGKQPQRLNLKTKNDNSKINEILDLPTSSGGLLDLLKSV